MSLRYLPTGRAALFAMLALAPALVLSGPVLAQDPPQNDNLNAVLWVQNSPEFRANATALFALAKIRLDQALADKSWTAVPEEQGADFGGKPPAVIVDIDETVLDNGGYQAWMVQNNESFNPKTWNAFVNSVSSTEVPGALDFCKYATSKGVTVFYVSNRNADEEPATRKNLEATGFPVDTSKDTVLTRGEIKEWGSAKGTRRAHIAKDFRVLLNIGDNFSDFVDDYRGTPAERLAVMAKNGANWGKSWIMIANPTYGSFESAPYKSNYKLPDGERRKAKLDALSPWKP